MPENTMPSASGSRMWYIIGGIVVLAVIGWFGLRMLSSGIMGAVDVNVNQNIDGSVTYSDEQGSVTVGGGSMPDNWPSDAPQNIAGASIQFSGNSNPQTGEEGAAVVYTANASVQMVVDHYTRELQNNGWTIEGTASMNGSTVVSATKDTRSFGVYIVDTGNGTVSVTAGLGIK